MMKANFSHSLPTLSPEAARVVSALEKHPQIDAEIRAYHLIKEIHCLRLQKA